MSADRDAVRDQLAAALAEAGIPYPGSRADALLPVVDRIANQRAAAELRAAAADVDDGEFSGRWSAAARATILARADALATS